MLVPPETTTTHLITHPVLSPRTLRRYISNVYPELAEEIVSCGAHQSNTGHGGCTDKRKGAAWCNGECRWETGLCVRIGAKMVPGAR